MGRMTHRRRLVGFIGCAVASLVGTVSLRAGPPAPALGRIPLRFEENQGQADPAARFVARGAGGVLLFTDREIVIAATDGRCPEVVSRPGKDAGPRALALVRLSFPGSNPQVAPTGDTPAPGVASYFTGRDPDGWLTGIPTFRRVVWRELYPGIDLVCYGTGSRLEYDFVVRPGADPGVIRLSFDGVEHIDVDGDGHLRLATGAGELVHQAPVVSQDPGDSPVPVAGAFRVTGQREVGFVLGDYDASRALVIDPVMQFCSFLGGNNTDWAFGIGEQSDGTLVVAGLTYSTDFPLRDELQGYESDSEMFLTAISADGGEVVFSTLIGGDSYDYAYALAVGPDDAVTLVGGTSSSDFPLVNPLQAGRHGTTDGAIVQVGARGTNLLFSSYYGGGGWEQISDVAVDGDSNICFVGQTYSSDLPVVNAVKATLGGAPDGFAVRLDAALSVVFSTYLGGAAVDSASAVAFGPAGSVTIAGSTSSSDFQPIGSGLQATYGGSNDVFVTRLSAGGALAWSTYLGGTGREGAAGIAVGPGGDVFVTGSANASGFPLLNAIRSTYGGLEAFLSRIRSDGTALVYSTLVGGNALDTGKAVVVDAATNAYVVGETESTDFPATHAWNRVVGGNKDAFLAAVDPAGDDWLFAAQFGGSSYDGIHGACLAANGDLLVVGRTYSATNFPVLNALQRTHGGGSDDAFFARMTTTSVAPVPFIDDFEWGGRLNGCWTPSSSTVAPTVNAGPHGGSYHLAFGLWYYSDARLAVSLAGRTSSFLRFWYKRVDIGDRSAELPDTFTGNVNGNGVAISDDGTNWVKIVGLSDSDGYGTTYQQIEVELDPIMAAHGISNAGVLYIKFIGYATTTYGGYHLVDDVTILSRSVQFEPGSYSTPEGTAATLTVVRSGSTAATESVDYATVGGDATEGVDYAGATGTVIFAVGDASVTIVVPVMDDPQEEPDETFRVVLRNPSPGLDFGAADEATVTIRDNDSSEVFPFRVGFESGALGACWATYTEVNGVVRLDKNDGSSGYPDAPMGVRSLWLDADNGAGGGYGLAELNLQIDLSGRTNVTLSFLARSLSGSDFTLPDSFVEHANGKGVSVSTDGTNWYKLQGLTFAEGASRDSFGRFTIDLDAAMATREISYGSAVRIKFSMYGNHFFDAIGFDDIQIYSPSFEFSRGDFDALETVGVVLTVLRKGDVSGTASVAYRTADGSAVAGSDYAAVSGTLNFTDGVASNTIAVPFLDEWTAEPDETFTVVLSVPSGGYSLGTLNPATVTITDDDTAAVLPFSDTFGTRADAWALGPGVGLKDAQLRLGDGGLREAVLTLDATGASNVILRLAHRQVFWDEQKLPETFTGRGYGDGVAISVDSTNWVKVLGLARSEIPDWRYTDYEVSLDPILGTHGLAYNGHLQVRFQLYSTTTSKEFWFDNVIVFSRRPIDISTTEPPHGTGMVAYVTTLAATNGMPPYTWSAGSGLPAGVTLSAAGVLSGTPTEEGAFPLDLSVVDGWGSTGQASVVLTIAPNPNRPPYETSRNPATNVWPMAEGTNALFTLETADPEGAPLTYTWAVDGTPVSAAPTNYLFGANWGDAGNHALDVRVSDGLWNNALATWQVEVTADNDGDGLPNAWERAYGLDPWNAADATTDPDGDYLVNTQEWALGTSPVAADSNGDSLPDGWSVKFGRDPLATNGLPRMDLVRRGALPVYTGTWDRVAAIGDAVYVARGASGLDIVDASDPDHPAWSNTWGSGDNTYDVTVASNRVYSCDGTNGLVKFDATDPLALVGLVRYRYPPAHVTRATVSGDLALVSLYDAIEDLQVLDVTDGHPSPFLGYLDMTNSWRDAAWSGSFAYVAGGDEEFGIIDMSTPSSPILRGTLPLLVGYQGYCVAVGEGAVYLAWQNRVSSIDVTDPDAPSVIVTNELPGNAQVVAMQNEGGFVFVGRNFFMSSGSGLSVYDGASAIWTSTIAASSADMQVRDLFATPDRVYLIDGTNGLVVYTYAGDYDQDGLPDAWERERLGTLAYGAFDDPDGDLVFNLGEWRAGTDPLDSDSDGDTMTDGWEIRYLMDPASSNAVADTDGDGIPDVDEQRCRTSPLDPADHLRILDSDCIGGIACITWWGMSGVTYRIHRSWDLGDWTLAPDGPAPDGVNPRMAERDGWETYLDPGFWSNVFYRLNVAD